MVQQPAFATGCRLSISIFHVRYRTDRQGKGEETGQINTLKARVQSQPRSPPKIAGSSSMGIRLPHVFLSSPHATPHRVLQTTGDFRWRAKKRSPAQAWKHSTGLMADAAQVADLMAVTWDAVDRALRPIIGQRGFTALYERSLYLNASVHGWLMDINRGADKPHNITALRDAQAQQSRAEAVAAGCSFVDVIGIPLVREKAKPMFTLAPRR